jgi:hypothetical protein
MDYNTSKIVIKTLAISRKQNAVHQIIEHPYIPHPPHLEISRQQFPYRFGIDAAQDDVPAQYHPGKVQ